MPPVLDASLLRSWTARALEALRDHREELDALNVFPVRDNDTGTNLLRTWESVDRALREAREAAGDTLGPAVTALARGALLGARGSSGVILSQVLRGLADVLSPLATATGVELQAALTRARELAYAAVQVPVEGTLLSVLTGAEVAARAADPDDLVGVAVAAARGAREALARTPGQLAVLAASGVVDAGGRGLVLVLDALAAVLGGGPTPPAEAVDLPRQHRSEHRQVDGGPAYEVQLLLDAPVAAVELLRPRLAALGDALVVVGGPQEWHVHVHVDDAGAALEACVEAGRPHRISVTHLQAEAASRR